MERYNPSTKRKNVPVQNEGFSDYQKKNETKIDAGQNYDKKIQSLQEIGLIYGNFSQAVDIKRKNERNFLNDNSAEVGFFPKSIASVLALASTIKYNTSAIDLMRIGDRYKVGVSRFFDDTTGKSYGEIGREVENMTLQWLKNHSSDKNFSSEFSRLFECNSYEAMSIKSKTINLSAFPDRLPNIPALNFSRLDIDKIKKYILFAKKSHLLHKDRDEKLMDFRERVDEMGVSELIIDRLESAVSKIRQEQNLTIMSGRKLLPLEKTEKNILKFVSTIQYNDAVWTLQTLGSDSGMRYADGVVKNDAEKNMINNDYISLNTMSWLVDYYDDKKFLHEMNRLLDIVEKTNSIRSIDEDWSSLQSKFDIDTSVFPDIIPNILVMKPVRFTVRK